MISGPISRRWEARAGRFQAGDSMSVLHIFGVAAPERACRRSGLAGAAMLASSTAAMAAEAYIQNGGAREKALAGAGVASSTDATAASLNPAGLVNVGSQLNASASFLYLNGGYTSAGPAAASMPTATTTASPAWSSFPISPPPGGSIGPSSMRSPSPPTATAASTRTTRTSPTPTARWRLGRVLRRPSRHQDVAELLLGGLRQGDLARHLGRRRAHPRPSAGEGRGRRLFRQPSRYASIRPTSPTAARTIPGARASAPASNGRSRRACASAWPAIRRST